MAPIWAGANWAAPRHIPVVGRRSYGTGALYARRDGNGRETWYGSWRVGGTRVKRRISPKRRPGAADGLTRTQAEAELRRRIATEVVVAGAQRRTVAETGDAYLDHLEHAMERKRTTLQDYRGYLRKHLAPFFGGRPLDKIDRARVEAYLKAKKRDGLSSKTVQNHLNFLLMDGARAENRLAPCMKRDSRCVTAALHECRRAVGAGRVLADACPRPSQERCCPSPARLHLPRCDSDGA
jgi:hypothetical protein